MTQAARASAAPADALHAMPAEGDYVGVGGIASGVHSRPVASSS